uniref:Uncharacterized protein n=1 Tax=Candidatus Kentrum sp. LFY TaxID=2126342 RepID=A0A450UP46_9GAMM|nr:MAG: hypothetical protein BECKLFY1418A_GA0070994_103822 [Candidatus Kentron sp. LFY]
MKSNRCRNFNEFADAIKNIAMLSILVLTLLYFMLPPFEIFFKDKALGGSYWFYVGSWSKLKNKYTEVLYALQDSDFNKDDGSLTTGNIIRATADSIVGRTLMGTQKGKVSYIGGKNDCLYVLDSGSLPLETLGSVSVSLETNKNAIWVKAIPRMCD